MPPDDSQSEMTSVTAGKERQLLHPKRDAQGFDIVGVFIRRKSCQVDALVS